MSHSGGTERVLSVVANGLSRRGFHVSVMSLWGKGQPFFALEDTIRIYWMEEDCGSFDIIRQLCHMTRILKKEQADFLIDVDMILGFYSFPVRLAGMKRKGLSWISWEHFNYYYHFPRNHYLRKIVRRLVCRWADALVVLTQEDRGYYCRNLKFRCPVIHIYNPVPYERVLKKTEEEKLILGAGRLTGVKGFDLLIDSWAMLEPYYPEWKLMIAGEGEDREKLERKARGAGLKNIVFAGRVKEIERLYQKAAFFVFPSRDEGFPMVLLEAMGFSLPAVSYSCKTGPGEIISDGRDGFLVELGQIEAFAEKMETLMRDENLRKKMGQNAGEVIRRFGEKDILDQWEALLARF